MTIFSPPLHRSLSLLGAIATILCVASGCGKSEKESVVVASVQTTPARRAPISQIISAEAVVYPLEQATVAPKISSTIRKFYVHRGARLKKGHFLPEFDNRDLYAPASPTTPH